MAQSSSGESVRVIDGASFFDFPGFCVEFSRSVLKGQHEWTGNLDAFNDLLGGGFGTPNEPWTLRWTHVARSREALGWEATKAWLAERCDHAHPSNAGIWRERLVDAERERGETLFEMIVSIVRDHGVGAAQSTAGVTLELEE